MACTKSVVSKTSWVGQQQIFKRQKRGQNGATFLEDQSLTVKQKVLILELNKPDTASGDFFFFNVPLKTVIPVERLNGRGDSVISHYWSHVQPLPKKILPVH